MSKSFDESARVWRPPPEATTSLKRELVESPESKQKLRDFTKELRNWERNGFQNVYDNTVESLPQLPKKIHFKVLLELADIAKRENKITAAKALYRIASKYQPYAHQVWLEYSKLEEEAGNMDSAARLLKQGLRYCPLSDQIAIKFIKTHERRGELHLARQFLSSMKDHSIEKTWKIVLEGALMEARLGNMQVARSILEMLMQNVGNFGTIFLEGVRFEEKWGGSLTNAISYCEEGLRKNPRYGPLWFAYLRVIDKLESEGWKKREKAIQQAAQSLSKELLWKLYLEVSFTFERHGDLQASRMFLVDAALVCPENLRWKVWMAGARVEVKSRQLPAAEKLMEKCLEEVPAKQKPAVLVEQARIAEYNDSLTLARGLMSQACKHSQYDWKVYLEAINLEMRAGDFERALDIAKHSLTIHLGTGRLWSAVIQLQHATPSILEQQHAQKSFQLAIREVPKSGEVWCEGARLRMNPYLKGYFDLEKAETYLNYAIQFTPQYGDSFIELLRLYLIQNSAEKISKLRQVCLNADPNYGMMWFFFKKSPLDGPSEIWKAAEKLLRNHAIHSMHLYTGNVEVPPGFGDNFWTGLPELNRLFRRPTMLNQEQRWKLIFGNEQIPV